MAWWKRRVVQLEEWEGVCIKGVNRLCSITLICGFKITDGYSYWEYHEANFAYGLALLWKFYHILNLKPVHLFGILILHQCISLFIFVLILKAQNTESCLVSKLSSDKLHTVLQPTYPKVREWQDLWPKISERHQNGTFKYIKAHGNEFCCCLFFF